MSTRNNSSLSPNNSQLDSFTSLHVPLIRAIQPKQQQSHLQPYISPTHHWSLNGQQLHHILGINRALPTVPITIHPSSIPPTTTTSSSSSLPPSVQPTARLSTIDPEVEETPQHVWLMMMLKHTHYTKQARIWMTNKYGYLPTPITQPMKPRASPIKSILKRPNIVPLTHLPTQSWCDMASTLLSCDMWLLMDILDIWKEHHVIACTRIERWLMLLLAILYGQGHLWILCFGSSLYLDFCTATHDIDYLRYMSHDISDDRKRAMSDVGEEDSEMDDELSNDDAIQRWLIKMQTQDEKLQHKIDDEEQVQGAQQLEPLMDVERIKLIAKFLGISDEAIVMHLQQHHISYYDHVTCENFKVLFYLMLKHHTAFPQYITTLETWKEKTVTASTIISPSQQHPGEEEYTTRCPSCVIL